MTAGFENASQELTASKVGEMINHQRNVDKWEFVFIGANREAVVGAREIGIPATTALAFAVDEQGTQIAHSILASQIRNYRRSNIAEALNFNEDDPKRQKNAGVGK